MTATLRTDPVVPFLRGVPTLAASLLAFLVGRIPDPWPDGMAVGRASRDFFHAPILALEPCPSYEVAGYGELGSGHAIP